MFFLIINYCLIRFLPVAIFYLFPLQEDDEENVIEKTTEKLLNFLLNSDENKRGEMGVEEGERK